ncbi:MAG: prephenate dehydratase [Planctomycetota bacterium]
MGELAGAVGGDDAVIDQMAREHAGTLPERSLKAVLHEVYCGCRALVHPARIAFLGPTYSYSHLAALHRFGEGVDYVPVGTIPAVFEEVHRGHSEFGLVPIENSTDGRIADSLDMFARVPVKISSLVEMRIHHTLLGACARSEVREVYSRPQALSQCRNWLARHLPGATTVEVTSTTVAAQLAKEKVGAAAIASRQAGANYGLEILAENIEDNPGNLTRFAVIGGEQPKKTGSDRTALLFQVEHRPGTLAEAMNIFKRAQVNLTWIESFPIPGSDRTYLFFVELEGHQAEARVRRALRSLEKKALRLEVIGSFPKPILVE